MPSADRLYIISNLEKAKGPVLLDEKWNANQVEVLSRKQAFSGMSARGGKLVLAGDGIHIVESDELVQIIDTDAGLPQKRATAVALAANGDIAVQLTQAVSIIRDGRVIDTQSEGKLKGSASSPSMAKVAANGDVWMVCGKFGDVGAARRNVDGSLDLFARDDAPHSLMEVSGFVAMPGGGMVVGDMVSEVADSGACSYYVAPGSTELRPFEPLAGFGPVVDGFLYNGALWVVTRSGQIVRLVDGEVARAFAINNFAKPPTCTRAALGGGYIALRLYEGLYGIALDTLEQALNEPADTSISQPTPITLP